MHCGEVSLKITDESISQLYEQGVKVPSWVRFAGRARFNTERAPLELRDLLAATSGCQVTDLRDKVFGLLGLVSNHQASDLSPNYELMVREVYIGVAAYLVQKAHCCDLIQYADSGNSVYGIPSWVPMWNTDMPLQAPQGISRHIQQIEFDSKSLLKEEGLIDCFTIRSIEGWPHDECSQCNRKYCKLADSDSGFLSTRIETVLRLDSSYQPVFTVSTKLWPLEPGEYFTHFWYREDGLKIAVRTFGWALRDTKFSTGIHLIRVEGCTTLFLAHQTSDSRHYRLVASCVAAIVCPTRESRPIETLKPDDLQRCLQFMPLTVEMIKFIAEWKKEILDMAISGTGNMENALPFDDEHSDYSSGDEPEISDQSWKSWIPFLGLEDRKVLEEDEELQKQLPDLIDFWHKAHKLYTAVRQWTKSALDVSDHVRSIFRFAYPGVVLKDLLRNSKKLGRIFKRITGKKVVVFKSLPTLRLLLDLSDNHQDGWATVYPHLLSALEEDQQFFDKPFPLDLEEKHPKYSSIKETIEWKAVLEGLVRNNVEEKEICFV
ncbi:hypothetical protein J7337_009030 [Fusarium musae]|uniref:Uncharacterized protein n=1 Tax=Fusarium musae TaxID=1042133 RepID=A0A9P8DEN1_9HYPO|nr:hypothetical protein J7337_009030 [Fusarium musae]KAG9500549.1 hypothetical protein J7337_009030 [Fusarium musae]